MDAADRWAPFGIDPPTWENVPDGQSTQIINLSMRRPHGDSGARSGTWLRCAMLALGLLAAAAAAVSFEAQYRMVFTAKGIQWAAALEAGIPDAAALVLASLAIALALHGRRAIRARVLNVASVATSIGMNLLAATPGWRNLAIWIMPPIAYALASDTAIGVIRAWVIARQRELGEALAEDEATPLAVLTGLALWTLRLVLAPLSTLRGFRTWVLEECPVAPGRRELTPPVPTGTGNPANPDPEPESDQPGPEAAADARDQDRPGRHRQGPSKTAQFLRLVEDRHGPLAAIDPARISRIAADLAPEVDLHPGSARSALRPLVLAAQNGHSHG
jgi:Protein of unknown function (DUF2637)